MIKLLGILGGILFAIAAFREAVKTIRAGKHLGTPVDVSAVICLGTVVQYLYLVLSYGFNSILFVNYLVGFVCWVILLIYGVFKRA